VTLEPTDRRYLIALDIPASVPEDATIGFDLTVTTRRPQASLRKYRASSFLDYVLEQNLRPGYRTANVELPEDFNPRTKAMIGAWMQSTPQPEQLIRRSLELFNAQFVYTLEPQLLGRNSVDDFLFNTRQGYCEHFASAFVVMMRMASIPARVVTGYQGASMNDFGDYWVVRQSDAHAWAEVWLEGQGWIRVDPTSAVAPERIERGRDALAGAAPAWAWMTRPITNAGDWLRRQWNDLVLGFNADRQRDLFRRFGFGDPGVREFALALGLGVAVALTVTLGLLLRHPRDPRDPLQRAYARFTRALARAGAARPPYEGPVAFAARAAALLPEVGEQVHALSQRYARRRYAAVDPDPGADRALCDELRRFRVRNQRRHVKRRSG
jgi:hypothetical protein